MNENQIANEIGELQFRVARLVAMVRLNSERARHALSEYPQAKAAAVAILHDASVHQLRAVGAARRLHRLHVQLDQLLHVLDRTEQADPDLREDLLALAATVEQWSAPPDKAELRDPLFMGDEVVDGCLPGPDSPTRESGEGVLTSAFFTMKGSKHERTKQTPHCLPGPQRAGEVPRSLPQGLRHHQRHEGHPRQVPGLLLLADGGGGSVRGGLLSSVGIQIWPQAQATRGDCSRTGLPSLTSTDELPLRVS